MIKRPEKTSINLPPYKRILVLTIMIKNFIK